MYFELLVPAISYKWMEVKPIMTFFQNKIEVITRKGKEDLMGVRHPASEIALLEKKRGISPEYRQRHLDSLHPSELFSKTEGKN